MRIRSDFLTEHFRVKSFREPNFFADYYGLNLHYVNISWDTVTKYLEPVEPQIFQAALQAESDGIEIMFVGESSDLIFVGMSGLLSKDWTLDEFMNRYIFTKPEEILNEPLS